MVLFKSFRRKSSRSEESLPSLTPRYGWKKILNLNLFNAKKIAPEIFDHLEEQLIRADFGGSYALQIIEQLKEEIKQKEITKTDTVKEILKEIVKKNFHLESLSFSQNRLPVLCFIGINGVGKTTTLAKIAHYFKPEYQVVIGAADTYRAAATLQLEEWAKKLQVSIVNKGEKADAASVAFDTIESALAKTKKHSTDGSKFGSMALIDTAGRLHNKNNLMDQLGKLVRVCERFQNQIERKNLLILDATLGQIGFDQVKIFLEKVGVDGIIVTKLDTQSKGGVLASISQSFRLPIYFVTYGEGLESIKPFDLDEYLASIF